jgi:AcrR family transcriptional regulator
VLDAVERVFLERGLKPVRIGDLAAEARSSRSTLYELAPNKEELFLLVLDRIMRRIARQGIEAAEGKRDPAAAIKAVLTSGALSMAPLGATFMDAVQSYPPAQWLFDHHIAESRKALERMVQKAIDGGRFRRVHVPIVAEGLFVATLRFIDPDFVRSTGITSSKAMGEFFDVLARGLAVPGEVPRTSGRVY